jgi:hypothetical protein
MRTIVGFGMALLLTIVLSTEAHVAMANEAQRAVDEANAALAAQPPQRDAARSALERATAAANDQAAVSEALAAAYEGSNRGRIGIHRGSGGTGGPRQD